MKKKKYIDRQAPFPTIVFRTNIASTFQREENGSNHLGAGQVGQMQHQ
jgi:hypothetical protein